MDEFIDPLLPSSSSWPDICASTGRSSWGTDFLSETRVTHGKLVEESVEMENGSNVSLVSPGDFLGNTSNNSDGICSLFVNGNHKYGIDKSLISPEHQLQCQGMMVNDSTAPLYGTKFNSNYCVAFPQRTSMDISLVKRNSTDLQTFPQLIGDASSISSVSMMWPTPYSVESSLNIEQVKPIEFNNAQNYPVPPSGCLPESIQINGAAKPRVRARRGQATDPHSIAERIRREKISERMKNLQELVPHSNKADKASMLDEIINYVKFLQLQVKVLSMSRLGSAGAVVPLITDSQSEIGGSKLSVGMGASDLLDTEDSLALEQEVVKLMESNITNAMQYLQNKGLCLMPIALASAISIQKGSISPLPEKSRGG